MDYCYIYHKKIPAMKKLLSTLLIVTISFALKAQNKLPAVVSGKIERIANFESKYVTARNIDVWLPAGYSNAKKYAVLYMHDGQMLFDANTTWNKQAWDVDDVASRLVKAKQMQEVIVVGIWNGGKTRHADYFPQKPFESLSAVEKDSVTVQLKRSHVPLKKAFKPKSDNYLKFIVRELKPYIDKTYSVHSNRENTYIMGSSMGGLISMYAICEYPQVFGGAACLSSHWTGTFTLKHNPVPNAFLKYLMEKLPNSGKHKIYFDCGDQTLDKLYPEIQKKVDKVMAKRGYSKAHWLSKYFPGENHSEDAWKKRLHVPLEFLLGK
jgi:predicted alpha/beta superfamily hydrolase